MGRLRVRCPPPSFWVAFRLINSFLSLSHAIPFPTCAHRVARIDLSLERDSPMNGLKGCVVKRQDNNHLYAHPVSNYLPSSYNMTALPCDS